MSAHDVEIRREDIGSGVASTLILALNDEISARYPEPGANHFRLHTDEVAEGRGAFVVAYLEGVPVGCGAIRRLSDDASEVKRIYVDPRARGRGIGRRVLATLEGEARSLGVRRSCWRPDPGSPRRSRSTPGRGFARSRRSVTTLPSALSVFMGKDF